MRGKWERNTREGITIRRRAAVGEVPCMMQIDRSGRLHRTVIIQGEFFFFFLKGRQERRSCLLRGGSAAFLWERFPKRVWVILSRGVLSLAFVFLATMPFTALCSSWRLARDPGYVESCRAAMWRDATCLHSLSCDSGWGLTALKQWRICEGQEGKSAIQSVASKTNKQKTI